LGTWLGKQKQKIKSDNDLYKKLSVNSYVKESLDRYLNKKDKFEEKMNELFKECDKNKNVPSSKTHLGMWLHDQKRKIKSIDNDLYKKLSVNSYVKGSLDKYLNNKDIDKLTFEEKVNELFEECDKNKKIPPQVTKLGKWFDHQKPKIKSIDNDLYKKLSVNSYVKESLDQYLNNKENKLTLEETINELFKECDKNKRIPKQKTKLGTWLYNQKQKIKSTDSELYKKLSANVYVKKHLDQYLNKKLIKEI